MALPWARELGHLERRLCPRDNHGDGRDADGSRGPRTHRVACPRVPRVRGHRAPGPGRHHARSRECLRGPPGPPLRSRLFPLGPLLLGGSALPTAPLIPSLILSLGPMTRCPTARPASPPRCLLNTQRASGPSGLEAADRGGGAVAGGGQQGLVSLQSSGYSPSSELAHRAQRRAPATQCEEKGNLQPHLLPPPSKHVPLQQLRPAPIQPSSSSSISPKAHDFTTPQKPRSYLLFLPYSQPSRPNIYYQILSMF